MTNLEALRAEIEPFSFSELALKRSLSKAGLNADSIVSDEKKLAMATCYMLTKATSITSESEGGFSQSYKDVEKRIKALCNEHGLNASLFFNSTPTVIDKSNIW